MDTTGQCSAGSRTGATADPDSGESATSGFLTRGIGDPGDYYYCRLFTDAVRAVDVARDLPEVDASRLAVAGASQGGAIAIAAAALSGTTTWTVAAALVDVPFLCDVRRAMQITDAWPYAELVTYCKTHRDRVDQVFRTLSYVDGVTLARRATSPALFSVALMDEVCPPSTVFAAYNHRGRATRTSPCGRTTGTRVAPASSARRRSGGWATGSGPRPT